MSKLITGNNVTYNTIPLFSSSTHANKVRQVTLLLKHWFTKKKALHLIN